MSLAALKQSKSGGRGAGNGYPNVLVLFQGAELANKAGRTPDKDVLTGLLVNSVDDLVANYDEHGMPTTVVQVKVRPTSPASRKPTSSTASTRSPRARTTTRR